MCITTPPYQIISRLSGVTYRLPSYIFVFNCEGYAYADLGRLWDPTELVQKLALQTTGNTVLEKQLHSPTHTLQFSHLQNGNKKSSMFSKSNQSYRT